MCCRKHCGFFLKNLFKFKVGLASNEAARSTPSQGVPCHPPRPAFPLLAVSHGRPPSWTLAPRRTRSRGLAGVTPPAISSQISECRDESRPGCFPFPFFLRWNSLSWVVGRALMSTDAGRGRKKKERKRSRRHRLGDRRGHKMNKPHGFAALVPRDRPAPPSLEDTQPLRRPELAMSLCLSLEFA
jgi:hypothetical protein